MTCIIILYILYSEPISSSQVNCIFLLALYLWWRWSVHFYCGLFWSSQGHGEKLDRMRHRRRLLQDLSWKFQRKTHSRPVIWDMPTMSVELTNDPDLQVSLSRKLSSASWSPSCFSKVLGGMESPTVRNFSVNYPPLPKQFGRGVGSIPGDTVSNIGSIGILCIFTLHDLHLALHTPHSTLCTAHFTLHTPHFTLDTPHSTLYTSRITLDTLHFTLHTLHLTPHTPHPTLYSLHFTLVYTAHLTLYTVRSTLYTLHCTLYTPHSTLYTWHSTLYTLHFTHYTWHTTFYTPHTTLDTPHPAPHTLLSTLHTCLHCTLDTVHCTLHTLHFALHTLHFTLHTLHLTLHTLHFTLHALHLTHYILHSTHYTWHPTPHTPHSTLYTSHLSTLHTWHCTLYAPHSTLYSPHSTLYTFTPYTLHFTLHPYNFTLFALYAVWNPGLASFSCCARTPTSRPQLWFCTALLLPALPKVHSDAEGGPLNLPQSIVIMLAILNFLILLVQPYTIILCCHPRPIQHTSPQYVGLDVHLTNMPRSSTLTKKLRSCAVPFCVFMPNSLPS